MKTRFVFFVAVGAIAITAFGALAEAKLSRTPPAVVTKSDLTPPAP